MLTRTQKGSSIYAVYDLSDKDVTLDKISMMMINQNQNHDIGLAAITLEEMNGHYTSMQFDVTGKIALREYIGKNISQNEFKMMLLNLVNTLENLDEYMIDVQKILLDIDSVFINAIDYSVSFVCIALDEPVSAKSLFQFFKEIVENSLVSTNNSEVSYFNRVWNVVHNENGFSLKNLKTAMMPAQTDASRQSKKEASSQNDIQMAVASDEPKRVEEPEVLTVKAKPAEPEYVAPVPPIVQDEKKKGFLGLFSSTPKKKKPAASGGFQGGLAGLNNAARSGGVSSPADVPVQQPVVQQPVVQQPAVQQPVVQQPVHAANSPESPSGLPAINLSKGKRTPAPGSMMGDDSVSKKPQRINPTQAMQLEPEPPELKPCLIRLKNEECFEINKPVILIGRERDGLDIDLTGNPRVGHKHAQIILRDGGFYIKDLESMNRTYVNGVVSPPLQETNFSEGDRIRIADEEFEFRIL